MTGASGRPRPGRRLVPAYLAAYGRAGPARTLDRLSLLHLAATPDGPPRPGATGPATAPAVAPPSAAALRPEERRLLEVLRPGALPLAEAAVHLRLPLSVVRVLVAGLVDAGHLHARPPVPRHLMPEREILEKVLDGLRTLKSC
ncbi:DUF742 domain-containing protein [Streptomyces sp. Z26]|uniref:DUF742 domain-containing protein n=1 Tax=Streptomyces TaxID=1883 RepID=UPI000EF14B5E|nr:DUF742 domain-containing protein [Streptomyces sp. Z26]RLL67364.1 DUF742 domain-containing protein [Streptomyces sp. Z26]